jgi:hypothetical protein
MIGLSGRRVIIQRAIKHAMDVYISHQTTAATRISASIALGDALMLAGSDAEQYAEQINTSPNLREERASWWQ